MRLTRNTTPDGKGKYALVRLDKIRKFEPGSIEESDMRDTLAVLKDYGVIEYGEPGSEEEFFVLKLKDKFTREGLSAYWRAVLCEVLPINEKPDSQFAAEVLNLCLRSASHPSRKKPD